MTEVTEYAVFEFLNHGKQYYRVNHVKKGMSLMQYVKVSESISKKEFYRWIFSVVEQLEKYYKSEETGDQAYGYLNPLSIILTEDGQVALLDITAEENKDLMKRMQKRNFRMLFVCEEQILTSEMEQRDDLYSWGRSLQFIWSRGRFNEKFSKIESWYLRRLIERCLTLTEKDILSELQWIKKEAKRLDRMQKERKPPKWGICLIPVLVGIFIFAGSRWVQTRQVKAQRVLVQSKEEPEEKTEKKITEVSEKNILCYVRYELPFLKAYAGKDDKEGWKQVKEMAQTVLKNPEWDSVHQLNENELEIRTLLAEAYEFEGDTDKALTEYKKLLHLVNDEETLNQILENLQRLYENGDEKDKKKLKKILEQYPIQLEEEIEAMEHIEEVLEESP